MNESYGMKVEYLGELRCEGMHLKSGRTVLTDAPLDNNGKAEAFSPTDLLCTSLAACMITIMGIAAAKREMKLENISASIMKVMASDPRRVSEIRIEMMIENTGLDEREMELLRRAALACPVAKSLHPEIHQDVRFSFYNKNDQG